MARYSVALIIRSDIDNLSEFINRLIEEMDNPDNVTYDTKSYTVTLEKEEV